MNQKTYAFMEQTGKLPYTFQNDLMFKLVLQGNKEVLNHLLCALLHLKPEEIIDTQILNPYMVGHVVRDKTCILDIRILLNRNRIVNLEMQVVNEQNWRDRSVFYLCRVHDQLSKGDDYKDAQPTVHIGIIAFDLDFAPEDNTNEFYAEHVLMNKRTKKIYSSKIGLNVLNLSHIEDATQEDRDTGLYNWAKLFSATTWEELKNMAEESKIYADAAEELYQHSIDRREAIDLLSHEMGLMDQRVREKQRLEDQERHQKTMEELEETKTKLAEYEAKLRAAGLL
jgi:predicted transposase/invertase (TIGR01784 family)